MKKTVFKISFAVMTLFFMAMVFAVFLPTLTAHAAVGDLLTAQVDVTDAGGTTTKIPMTFKILSDPSGSTPGTVQVGNGAMAIPSIDNTTAGAIVIPVSLTDAAGNTYNVTAIGDYAFYSCKPLTNVTIQSGVTTIGDYAFSNCNGLTNFTIPEGVTTIEIYAFQSCINLTEITIPSSVTVINGGAFQLCRSLTEVTIPDGIDIIAQNVFKECYKLHTVNLPSSVKTIGITAFAETSDLANIDLQHVQTIGDYAFAGDLGGGNDALTSVDLSSATSIGEAAFQLCEALTSVTIPYGVTAIGDLTFSGCKALQSVVIPKTVTTVGADVFKGCELLSSIYYDGDFSIGLNTADIPDYGDLQIYYNADALGWGADVMVKNLDPNVTDTTKLVTPIPIKVTHSATQFVYDGSLKTVNVTEIAVDGTAHSLDYLLQNQQPLVLTGTTATAAGSHRFTVSSGVGSDFLPLFEYTNFLVITNPPEPEPEPAPVMLAPLTGVYNR